MPDGHSPGLHGGEPGSWRSRETPAPDVAGAFAKLIGSLRAVQDLVAGARPAVAATHKARHPLLAYATGLFVVAAVAAGVALNRASRSAAGRLGHGFRTTRHICAHDHHAQRLGGVPGTPRRSEL